MSSRAVDRALLDRVRLRLASGTPADPGLPSAVAAAARLESDLLVDSTVLSQLSAELAAELSGAGPLEELLALPDVTDVLVNAPDRVFVDRGDGLHRVPVAFESDAAVRRLATRLAGQAGRRLDDAAPFVDAVLPDGTRLHAILPPLVATTALSLRVLRRRRLSLTDLVRGGAMPPPVAELLQAIVSARLTLLVAGGTGTGKTTLLGALLGCADPRERIVTIEDAPELAVEHPHVLALLARAPNAEGAGAVDLRELVRQSLRMRVDRLVVGEFRGAEVIELLAALNTGHSGGAGTVHANSTADIPARLTALAALGGMSAEVLAAQADSAVDVLIQLSRDRSGVRRLVEIALWNPDGSSMVWSVEGGVGPAAVVLARRLRRAGVEPPALLDGAP